MMEAVLVLATVAQRYRLKLMQDQVVEPWPVFTLRPRNGIKMVLEKRGTHSGFSAQ
jgi:hypothetical protein